MSSIVNIWRSGVTVSTGASTGRSTYGNETVSEITCLGSTSLNGTIVTGKVSAGGSITANNANVERITAGGNADIISTVCSGKISAGGSITGNDLAAQSLSSGGSITLTKSNIPGQINAGGSVTATQSNLLGAVNSGGSIELFECPSVDSVSTGGGLRLRQTHILNDASVGGDVDIKNSKIDRTLTCVSKNLRLETSTINTIHLKVPRVNLGNGDICKLGHRNHFFHPFCPEVPRWITIISVVLHIFTLCIPLMLYYAFDVESFCSISISRSGIRMTTDNTHAAAQENLRSQQAASQEQTRQILHLDNCQVENVIFESGNGEIVLTGNSQVTGTITGGKIREEVQQ